MTGVPVALSALMLRRAVWGKHPGPGSNEPGFLRAARSLSRIGG